MSWLQNMKISKQDFESDDIVVSFLRLSISYTVAQKNSHFPVFCYFLCETFSGHWVWNRYAITAVYFRKSKEEVYNILKQKTVIKHDSYKSSVPMDNRELRTNILSSDISIENAEDVKSSSKSQKYCWRIEKNKWEVYTLQNYNPDLLQLHTSK